MQLVRFRLSNFRGIRELDLELEDLEVIFGRNNTGKSTVLEALSEYAKLIRGRSSGNWYTNNVRNRNENLAIEFVTTLHLSHTEIDRLAEKLRSDGNHLSTHRDVRFFIENFDGYIRTVNIHRKRGLVESKLEFKIDGEWKIVTKLERGSEGSHSIRRRDLTELNGITWTGIKRGDVDKFSTVVAPANFLLREKTDDWRQVSAFRRPSNSNAISESYELKEDASNLPRVLHTLDNNRRESFHRIVETYASMMEGVVDVQTRISGSGSKVQTRPYIIEDEAEYSLSEISAGSKELLALLTEIETADVNAELLMLEEPETHLHPGAQRTLFEYIQDATERADVQIVLTTHSEVFINNAPPESLLKSVRKQGGSEFESIEREDVTQELAEIGYDKSGLLQSKAVVFVEGRSDIQILREFAKTLGYPPAEHGTELVELEGEGNMNAHGQSLVKLLAAFGIPYLFIQDAHDDGPREAQIELLQAVNSEGGDWQVSPDEICIWDEYEIEAHLLDTLAIAKLLNADESDIQEAKESSVAKTPSDVLNEVFETVAGTSYNKVEHGPMIARHIPEKRIPEGVKNVINEIQSLQGDSTGR